MNLNTYAEVRRLCNVVKQFSYHKISGDTVTVSLGANLYKKLYRIQHPSKDYFMYGNDSFYLIIDGTVDTLYKMRK